MEWTHHVFEVVTYALFAAMAIHAWFFTDAIKLLDEPPLNKRHSDWATKLPLGGPITPANLRKPPVRKHLEDGDVANRGRWLATLIYGALFGVAIEYAMISTPNHSGSHNYVYGNFYWMLGNPFDAKLPVPACVGIGWGVILYAATWSAQRIKHSALLRALFAGLLAVNIDLSLDPIAEALGFWHWNISDASAGYYRVPYDNFVNWLSIVVLYTGSVRLLFRRFEKTWASTFWVPPLAAAFSLGIAWLISEGLQRLYAFFDRAHPLLVERPTFMVLFVLSIAIILRLGTRPTKNLELSRLVLLVPLVIPLLAYVLMFVTEQYRSDALCSLLVTVPLTVTLGLFGFTWGSWDFIIKRAEHDTRTAQERDVVTPANPISSIPPAYLGEDRANDGANPPAPAA